MNQSDKDRVIALAKKCGAMKDGETIGWYTLEEFIAFAELELEQIRNRA